MALRNDFEERKNEVCLYIDLLQNISKPGQKFCKIDQRQRNILFANLYLLLYNLIESTVCKCEEELTQEFSQHSLLNISLYIEKIKSQWIMTISQAHNQNMQERETGVKKLFEKLLDIENNTLGADFRFKKSTNVDNTVVEDAFTSYGIPLEIDKNLKTEISCHRRNNEGLTQLIRNERNALAHGNKSFVESGQDITFSDAKQYANIIFKYLESIIASLESFISEKKYLCAYSKKDKPS